MAHGKQRLTRETEGIEGGDASEPATSNRLLYPSKNLRLWQLKFSVEDDRFIRIFAGHARLIRDSEQACEVAASDGREEYAEFIAEMEADYLEEMIGAAFLILQSKIRRVTRRTVELAAEMKELYQITLPDLAEDKSVRALGGPYKSTNHSLVEFVWAFGNYFKHREEWGVEVWEHNAKKRSAMTRRMVEVAGVVQFSTGNMRRGFEFLDVKPYSSCGKLAEAVQDWAKAVYATAQNGLKAAVRQD